VARKLAVNRKVLCAAPAYLARRGTPRVIDDMDALHAAVVAGMGIGVLPVYVAADDMRRGRLVRPLREFQLLPDVDIYLAYLPNRTLSRRVRALIDFLVQRFEPAPPWETGW
jgi:DNA-binding transcriptional LysR family regulator